MCILLAMEQGFLFSSFLISPFLRLNYSGVTAKDSGHSNGSMMG
jgi:hypothetical protein